MGETTCTTYDEEGNIILVETCTYDDAWLDAPTEFYLKSPDGSFYKITISNLGILTIEKKI